MTMSLDDAKIRLEGAYERLERTRDDLRATTAMLAQGRWRSAVYDAPGRLSLVADFVRMLDDDLPQATALVARETSDELGTFLRELDSEKNALAAVVKTRLGSDLPLPEALRALEKKANAELPKPLEPGEEIVMSGGFRRDWWKVSLAWAVGLGWVPVALGCGMSGIRFGGWIAGAAAIGVTALAASPPFYRRRSGRYVLTNRRLLYDAVRQDPVEVPLSSLRAGSAKVTGTLRTVEIRDRNLTMVGVHHADELVVKLELERWLATRSDTLLPSAQSPYDHALLPLISGAGQSRSQTGWIFVRPTFVAWIRTLDLRYAMTSILGGTPWCKFALPQIIDAVRRLPETAADETMLQVADASRAIVAHRETATLTTRSTLWGTTLALASDAGDIDLGTLDYNQRQQVERLLEHWSREPAKKR